MPEINKRYTKSQECTLTFQRCHGSKNPLGLEDNLLLQAANAVLIADIFLGENAGIIMKVSPGLTIIAVIAPTITEKPERSVIPTVRSVMVMKRSIDKHLFR